MSDIIYFDNSATTSVYPEVLSAMNEVYLNCYGNPSSLHKLGNEADKLLQKSRETVAKTLNVMKAVFILPPVELNQITGL
ncbi:aminotransferase class V-fold PLP-dependent enzyme [Thermoclostridium stercorarium]|uniref:aminotransferase class V-fold PLP-dependent enzyme n=1 Tax=Thermoclostridium stercorarium TaxID=1510 RepID=UPI000AB5B602